MNKVMSSKTYLITGAAGFIGARFVESCLARGISVISVDLKSHFQERSEIPKSLFGTQVDRLDLFNWLKSSSSPIDAIIHLGAITDTREMNLARLNELNLEYSQKLWNYASENKIHFVYASSAATYGDGALGYDDDEKFISRLKPLNPYGESKQKFDLWALDQEKRGMHPPHWSGFKFFNVYGFGERHKKFMASVVLHAFDQIQEKGSVTLFKSHRDGILDGHQKRDFILVDDVIDVLHFALEKPIHRGIFNLGTGKARTFLDLAKAVFASLRQPEHIEFVETPLSIRDKYQYFTEAKMENIKKQGYHRDFTSLEEGIKRYVQKLTKN